MRRYETVEEAQDEMQKVWDYDYGAVTSDERLFNVTLYADVSNTWRRFIIGPLDAALVAQFFVLDGDRWAIEDVRRVIIGSSLSSMPYERYPEICVW